MRIRLFVFWGIVLSTFIVGAFLGFFKGNELYSYAYQIGVLTKTKREPRDQLLTKVFNEAVYEGELKYVEINNLSEIKSFQERNLVNIVDYENAIEKIHLLRVKQLYFAFHGKKLPVIEITFEFLRKEYRSYVYGKLTQRTGETKYATLIIPGTGNNQSSAIYSADFTNYHYGILGAIAPLKGNVFVLVKPNEDFLAIHNGRGFKLNERVLINYNLNNKSSYSASYLLNALAFMKWVKTAYMHTVIAGLSQGAAAALYLSQQTKPDIAIISSGHSILLNDVNIGNESQLLGVPGYVDLFSKEKLRTKLQNSTSNYFFSWGKLESDYYGIESREKLTASWIEDLRNVKVVIHEGGHEFPVNEIHEYLTEVAK